MKVIPSLALLLGIVAPTVGPLLGGDSSSVVTLPKLSVSTWVPVKKVGEYKMKEARFGPAAAAVDGKIYIFGGMNARDTVSNTIECFDPATNTSAIVGEMRRERFFHRVAAVGSRLVIIGGYNGTKNDEKASWMMPFALEPSVEIFDSKDGSSSEGPAMQTPRVMFGCAAVGNAIYVVGGDVARKSLFSRTRRPIAELAYKAKDRSASLTEVQTMAVTRSMEVLDMQSMTWKDQPPMPTLRECNAVWVPGDFIVVMGGYDGHSARKEVEAFDIHAQTWHSQPALAERVSGASVVFCGRHLLGFGDYRNPGTITAYDLQTKTSEQFELQYTPARHGAVVIAGGKIYVIGGKRYADSSCLAIVQVFEYIPRKDT